MKQPSGLPGGMFKWGLAVGMVVTGVALWAQTPGSSLEVKPNDEMVTAIHELQDQIRELRAAVTELRAESAQYRAETAELRHKLENSQDQHAALNAAIAPEAALEATGPGKEKQLDNRIASLEESSQLLSGKVDEQYQTKVESASKYRVRLSGIAVMNLFSNRGATDNLDFPAYAPVANTYAASGAFGATLRQSQLGLEVFGPAVAGARTYGEVQVDFSGGFPNTHNGVTFGLVRMRTADLRMDWSNTSVVVGQDNLFLSPLSPTSFASLAAPAFSYAGNLWGWIPQVRVEHRFDFSDTQNITVQAGIFDNVTGEPPYGGYGRGPQAGERSGQPAYGMRTAWTHTMWGVPLRLGAGGYYSRQDWAFDRYGDGWAGMADWEIPFTPRFVLTGEFYRGRALGGLGGGVGRSSIYNGSLLDPTTQVRALNAIGGWSQLKWKVASKLEFNGAFGLDNPMAGDLKFFVTGAQSYIDPRLAQNRSALVNFIYRPRSNLVFSTEYRHFRTFEIGNTSQTADQLNMVMGVLF